MYGSQYTSSLFEGTLQNSGINHSYSRKGHPYDNARIESFHSLIKREMIYHEEYRTIDDVRVSCTIFKTLESLIGRTICCTISYSFKVNNLIDDSASAIMLLWKNLSLIITIRLNLNSS